MNVLRAWMRMQMLFYAWGMYFQKSKSQNKPFQLSENKKLSRHHHEIIDLKGKSRAREG